MNRLKELRIENSLTMKDAAKRLGLPYTTYVNYEKGYREPNSELLIAMANSYKVTVDYLVGNVADPNFYLDNQRIKDEINSYGNENSPAGPGKAVSDDDIKFALFDGEKGITDAQFEEVKQFAKFVRERDEKKGK